MWVWQDAGQYGFRPLNDDHDTIEQLRGADLHVIGDSVSRQFAVSLQALLTIGRRSVPAAGIHDIGGHQDAHLPAPNASILFHWAPYASNVAGVLQHLQVSARHDEAYSAIVILNVGWWFLAKQTKQGGHVQRGCTPGWEQQPVVQHEMKEISTMMSAAANLQEECSRCRVVYRSTTAPPASHPDGSDCNQDDVRNYNTRVSSIAHRSGIDVIDAWQGTHSRQPNYPLLPGDKAHVHFQKTGQFFLTDLWLNYLFACSGRVQVEQMCKQQQHQWKHQWKEKEQVVNRVHQQNEGDSFGKLRFTNQTNQQIMMYGRSPIWPVGATLDSGVKTCIKASLQEVAERAAAERHRQEVERLQLHQTSERETRESAQRSRVRRAEKCHTTLEAADGITESGCRQKRAEWMHRMRQQKQQGV
jgi:hypothetical protein